MFSAKRAFAGAVNSVDQLLKVGNRKWQRINRERLVQCGLHRFSISFVPTFRDLVEFNLYPLHDHQMLWHDLQQC